MIFVLMLTRKKDESFVVEVNGELVKIMITRIATGEMSGKKEVQVGIEAPKHIRVWRTEIFDAIQENQRAAKSTSMPQRLRDLFSRRR